MKRFRHICSIIQVLLFFALFSFVMANDLFHFNLPPKVFIMEHRFISKKPVFDLNLLDPFPAAYNRYYEDRFPYRINLIGVYAGVRFRFFHLSPYPDKVDLGHDGWMFYSGERAFYENTLPLPDGTIARVVSEIHERARYYHDKGILFYLAIPPVKSEIYPEYNPRSYVKCPGKTFVEQVQDQLQKDSLIHLIDLKSALLKAKKYGTLYYKTDNHWNPLGGYYGYRAIMDCMKKDFPGLAAVDTSDFTMEKKTIKGKDLAEIMNLADYITEEDLVPHMKKERSREGKKHGYKPRPGFGYPLEFETVTEVDNPSLPILLVVRDSYFYGLMPYLIENFRKTVILYDTGVYGIFDDATQIEKPDLVLYMIFETHLIDMVGINF